MTYYGVISCGGGDAFNRNRMEWMMYSYSNKEKMDGFWEFGSEALTFMWSKKKVGI